MRLFILFFLFHLSDSSYAQFLGGGYTYAHQHSEFRMTFGNRPNHHEWQAFLEVFVNPRGETKKGAFFNGRRYALDSLDYVGVGGRYAYHLFKEKKQFMPYIGYETNLSPTGMRMSLQQSDGSFKEVFFRRTFFWDNYLLGGVRFHINSSVAIDINGGYGLVRIFGIPSGFTFKTKSGILLDTASYLGIGIKYFPGEFKWR